MKTLRTFLVIRGDGNVRLTKRPPRLALDEVSVQLNLKFPDGWGRNVGSIDIDVPGPPVAVLAEE